MFLVTTNREETPPCTQRTVLQKILSAVSAGLDVRNARNLFLAVEALLAGRRLTLTELARHFPGAERIHAPLKRFDRLLGNRAIDFDPASESGAYVYPRLKNSAVWWHSLHCTQFVHTISLHGI